jgi:hypothetical protein
VLEVTTSVGGVILVLIGGFFVLFGVAFAVALKVVAKRAS